MSTLDEKAKENQYPYNYPKFGMWAVEITEYISRNWFKKGYELCKKEFEDKLQWISVDEKEPECTIEDEGIYWSEYLEIKVKGYNHPFIGYYVKANDDQFFDFIHKTVDEGIKQEDITHYRFIH